MNLYAISKKKNSYFGRRSLQLIAVTFMLFYVFGMFAANRVEGNTDISYQKYVVQEGDTIWAIACSMIHSEKNDPREYVYAIQKINNVGDSIINPGDILLLPIDE